jgi:hypothetical protein
VDSNRRAVFAGRSNTGSDLALYVVDPEAHTVTVHSMNVGRNEYVVLNRKHPNDGYYVVSADRGTVYDVPWTVRHVSATGEVHWSLPIEFEDYSRDWRAAAAVGPEGQLLLSLPFPSTGGFIEYPAVVAIGPNGVKLWERHYPDYRRIEELVPDDDAVLMTIHSRERSYLKRMTWDGAITLSDRD